MDPIEEVKSNSKNSNITKKPAEEIGESSDSLSVLFKRFLPILLLVALLAFLYWFWNTSCNPNNTSTSETQTASSLRIDSSSYK